MTTTLKIYITLNKTADTNVLIYIANRAKEIFRRFDVTFLYKSLDADKFKEANIKETPILMSNRPIIGNEKIVQYFEAALSSNKKPNDMTYDQFADLTLKDKDDERSEDVLDMADVARRRTEYENKKKRSEPQKKRPAGPGVKMPDGFAKALNTELQKEDHDMMEKLAPSGDYEDIDFDEEMQRAARTRE